MSTNRPRRRRKSPASRVRPFWILIVLAFFAAAAATIWAATWPGLYPQRIDVEGNRTVPRAVILEKAGILRTQNLWLQQTAPIVRRVESIPYVDTARVLRALPADATIVVTERTPFAVVQAGEHRVLVDRALRVLGDAQGNEPLVHFIVKPDIHVAAGAFLDDSSVKMLRDSDDRLIEAHVIATTLALDRFGGLIATLRGGVRVLVGDDEELDRKIALIEPILAQASRGGRRIVRLDVRAPAAPVVVYAR